MCTMICETTNLEGSAKGQSGWFKLKNVNVTYDHPFNAPWKYGINHDFLNHEIGVGSRVAVELDAVVSVNVNVPPALAGAPTYISVPSEM